MTDEQQENAALYALGLLEKGEHEAFEAALARDPDLATLVSEHRAVLAILSLSAELRTPPDSLRQAILSEAAGDNAAAEFSVIETDRSDDSGPDKEAGRNSGSPFARIVPWALAACLAVGCGFLVIQMNELKRKNAELAQQAEPGNLKIAVLAAQSPELPDISASVAWNARSGTGVLETVALPSQGPNKTYQLWVFEKDNPAPVSAGIFDPARDSRLVFQPERPVTNATTFAVSVEVAGGRPQPEGPVVLAGNLQES